jgi:hypothetical protein
MKPREKGKNIAIMKEQCIAARGLIGWSRQRLSDESGVSMRTLSRFEEGESIIGIDLMFSVWKTLTGAGVEFIPENGGGAGVRLARRKPL